MEIGSQREGEKGKKKRGEPFRISLYSQPDHELGGCRTDARSLGRLTGIRRFLVVA